MLGKVERLFRRQQERGKFPGGQLVVRARGEEKLSVSVGIASGLRPEEGEPVPVTNATPFQVMSASKPVIALAVAILEDRGLLNVERTVSHYIPEFASHGKNEITVLEVLTHRSGVLVPKLWDSPEVWPDWDRVQEEIQDARPLFRRGTLAYHPWEFGWILGELVHRVAGKHLPEFLDEVLPGSLKALRLQTDPGNVPLVARTYWQGPKRLRLGGHDVAGGFEERMNAPSTLASLVPGASMTTTASTLALFHEMILHGWLGPHPYGWWNTRECVGHGGGFCVVAYSDRRTGAAVAIVTNANKGFGDVVWRFAPLGSAIRRGIGGES